MNVWLERVVRGSARERRGPEVFDDDVANPALHERRRVAHREVVDLFEPSRFRGADPMAGAER